MSGPGFLYLPRDTTQDWRGKAVSRTNWFPSLFQVLGLAAVRDSRPDKRYHLGVREAEGRVLVTQRQESPLIGFQVKSHLVGVGRDI